MPVSAHHWGRRAEALGHTVKLMPPSYVKAYLKRSKNDANDAAAICEAVTRPSMRFVPIKTEGATVWLDAAPSRQFWCVSARCLERHAWAHGRARHYRRPRAAMAQPSCSGSSTDGEDNRIRRGDARPFLR